MSFEQAITITTYQVTSTPSGSTTDAVAVIESRLASLQELRIVALADVDADGYSSLLDACPANPYCSVREQLVDEDGDGRPQWGDVNDTDPAIHLTGDQAKDATPSVDLFTDLLSAYETPESLVQAILEENGNKNLFPAADLIQIASDAGFPSEQVQMWNDEFNPPSETCRECFKRVLRECRPVTRPLHRGAKHFPLRKGKNGRGGDDRRSEVAACWKEGRKDCVESCGWHRHKGVQSDQSERLGDGGRDERREATWTEKNGNSQGRAHSDVKRHRGKEN